MNTNQMTGFNPEIPTSDYIVRGIALGQGENPGIRKELREFKKDEDLWNLYLLGLWQFQRLDQDHPLSYFQIAGIHGLPYQPWPKDDELLKKLKEYNTGFCTHTSILFLTWHRPYLALFESVLQQSMLYVANQYTLEEGREMYVDAAKRFRMPYWDWARPKLDVFPDEAINEASVSVVMPASMREADPDFKLVEGNQVKISNPLLAYKFQEGTSENIKVHKRTTTTRWDLAGSEKLSLDDEKEMLLENITPMTRNINKTIPIEGNLGERVMYLLLAYKSFSAFSNNKWELERLRGNMELHRPNVHTVAKAPGFGSIEDIHNTLHNLVGGSGEGPPGAGSYNGQMANIDTSAFDPIFWLHHANIDRLVAIWQGLHDNPNDPDTWVTSEATGSDGTWVTKPEEVEGLDTPLAPFYKAAGTFWSSRDVKETTTFGYVYPETQWWKFKNKDEYRTDIKKQILDLYPLTSPASMIRDFLAGDQKPEVELRKRAEGLAQISKTKQPTTLTALSLVQATSEEGDPKSSLASILPPVELPAIELPAGRSLSTLAKDNKYLEWLFNIKAEKHSLGGKYLVHVFLGPVPHDEPTHLYTTSPYHVGNFAPLGQTSDTKCGNCQRDQEAHTEISGQIPLTIALIERYFAGLLDSFSEDDVVEYLKMDLHWEVTDASGTRCEKARSVVGGLLVGVSSNEATIPQAQYDLPHYSSQITLYPEITTKQDGVHGRAEGTGITAANIFTPAPPAL